MIVSDSKVKVFSIRENTRIKDLEGHEDAVQAVVFDKTADYLVSCGSGKNSMFIV